MVTTKHSSKQNGGKKALITTLAVVAVAGLGFGAYTILHDSSSETPTAATAKSDAAGDNQKNIPQTTPSAEASGTDQNGASTNTTPSSDQWTKSKDGTSIVVYSPTANSEFTSGSTVNGTATSKNVMYRLTDDVTGLLTSGTASVVNGKFSVKLSFSTSASTGNIEIFNQSDPYGPESNNVLVSVRFK